MIKKGIKHFAARLLWLRYKKELSQEKLANLACVSRYTISNYECKRKVPNIQIAERLSKALDVSVGYLINGE